MNREIRINRMTNGYYVTVGCMGFVFNSFNEMVKEMKQYHDKPNETEKKWFAELERQNISGAGENMAPPPVDAEMPQASALPNRDLIGR